MVRGKNPGLVITRDSFAENDAQSYLSLYENRLFKRDPLILTGTLPFPLRAAAQTRIAWGWRTRLPQPRSPCTAALQNTWLYATEMLLTCSERPGGAQQQGRCSAGATFSICQPTSGSTRLGIDQTDHDQITTGILTPRTPALLLHSNFVIYS